MTDRGTCVSSNKISLSSNFNMKRIFFFYCYSLGTLYVYNIFIYLYRYIISCWCALYLVGVHTSNSKMHPVRANLYPPESNMDVLKWLVIFSDLYCVTRFAKGPPSDVIAVIPVCLSLRNQLCHQTSMIVPCASVKQSLRQWNLFSFCTASLYRCHWRN